MKYKPTQNYLLIKPEAESDTSEGGIYIPEQARKTLHEGEIIALGPDCSISLKVRMFVVFIPNSEHRLDIDGDIIFLLKEDAVLVTREAELTHGSKIAIGQIADKNKHLC